MTLRSGVVRVDARNHFVGIFGESRRDLGVLARDGRNQKSDRESKQRDDREVDHENTQRARNAATLSVPTHGLKADAKISATNKTASTSRIEKEIPRSQR